MQQTRACQLEPAWAAGSLAENIGAIVSGEAKPRAAVTYVMAGVTVLMLLATTTWATILIRCGACCTYS